MSKSKIAILIFIVAALAGAGVYLIQNSGRGGAGSAGIAAHQLDIFGNPASPAGGGDRLNVASGGGGEGSGSIKTYINTDYGFSFSYPAGFTVSAFPEGEGDTVLVQRRGVEVEPPAGGSTSQHSSGFQIHISPFDEPGPITPERIKKDIPDMIVDEPREITIGPEVESPAGGQTSASANFLVPALAFLSGDAQQNRTREIWFVNGSNLHQITAPQGMDEILSKVLGTWKFR